MRWHWCCGLRDFLGSVTVVVPRVCSFWALHDVAGSTVVTGAVRLIPTVRTWINAALVSSLAY